jgi:hypothetical protein
MAPTPRLRLYILIGFTTLVLEWTWVLFGRPGFSQPRQQYVALPSFPSIALPVSPFHRPSTTSPPHNADDIFDHPPLDSPALRDVCSATEWNPSVIFTCTKSGGGVGNVRNSILACLRFAISAGAQLVLPEILVRNNDDISEIWTNTTTGLDYMFDVEHFIESLRLSCPGLVILPSADMIPTNAMAIEGGLAPETLGPAPRPRTGMAHPELWRGRFDEWLDAKRANLSVSASAERPSVVALGRSYLVYPIHSDGEELARSFGQILKFRHDTRRLATTVFNALISNHNLPYPDLAVLPPNAYIGAHLRTEKDATKGWPPGDWVYSRYATQAGCYINQTLDSGLSVMYVASGDLAEIQKLASDAAAHNITITTKSLLLADTPALGELEKLAWDQQALVDFLVLTRASDFAGVAHSSFAWNIALLRHVAARRRGGAFVKGYGIMYDELSIVYGSNEGFPHGYPEYPATLWP